MTERHIDLLIKGGSVYDGTGSPGRKADIGVKGDKIAFVGSAAPHIKRSMALDAAGLSVAPGFIDTHGHSEFTLLADPRAEGKIFQGITTEINGNCGLSAGPILGDAQLQRQEDLREFGIKETWSSLGQYMQMLEIKGLTLNFATLAGHGNIRASVMGYKNRRPEPKEMKSMKALLRSALKEGAIGLSTGLIYPPGVYSDTQELIGLTGGYKPLRKGLNNPFIYASHMRSEGQGLIEAIDEVIKIGRSVPSLNVHISHIKTSGRENWHKIDGAISLMKRAIAEGVRLTCDRYPYTASSTGLDSLLPPWVFEGGSKETLKRLKTPGIQKKIKDELLMAHPDTEFWNTVTVSSLESKKNKWMEGKDIKEISTRLGLKPVDAIIHILIDDNLRTGGIFHSMDEGNLRRFLKLPFCMLGTDSVARSFEGPTAKGKIHPRGFGSFPRFLGRYARDEGLMSTPEAIHKITMLPAKTFGIMKRGQIKKGFKADIVIFDEKAIIDRATFDKPFRRPDGIHHVIVNGVPVLKEGKLTGMTPGRVLRGGQ